jgi:hypothetical protein
MLIPKHPHTNEILFHLLTCSLYSVKEAIKSCKDESLLSDLKQVENYLEKDYFEQAVYEIEHRNRRSKNNPFQVWGEDCLVQLDESSEILLVKPLWDIVTTHGTQNEGQSPEEFGGLGRSYFIDIETFQTQVAQFRIDRLNNNLLNIIKYKFEDYYSNRNVLHEVHLLELTGNEKKVLAITVTRSGCILGYSGKLIDEFKKILIENLGIDIKICLKLFNPLSPIK